MHFITWLLIKPAWTASLSKLLLLLCKAHRQSNLRQEKYKQANQRRAEKSEKVFANARELPSTWADDNAERRQTLASGEETAFKQPRWEETGETRELILFVVLQVSPKGSFNIEISYKVPWFEPRLSPEGVMLNEGYILRWWYWKVGPRGGGGGVCYWMFVYLWRWLSPYPILTISYFKKLRISYYCMYMTHICGGVYHTVQMSEDNLVKLVLSTFSEVPEVELRSPVNTENILTCGVSH